ncbi:hypothetical protein [Paraburkholderia sp. EG304]|uniref:hypothetical protein n=1 Tax=Paraburkholderia sp. EG304 TaxID=3237015 RepID=UPI00397C54E6
MSCATPAATSSLNQTGARRDVAASRVVQPEQPFADVECLLSIARDAGMLVLLDAQIGRERYQSVAGSVTSLQRFASALLASTEVHRGPFDRSQ